MSYTRSAVVKQLVDRRDLSKDKEDCGNVHEKQQNDNSLQDVEYLPPDTIGSSSNAPDAFSPEKNDRYLSDGKCHDRKGLRDPIVSGRIEQLGLV